MDIAALILAILAFAFFVYQRSVPAALLTAAIICQWVALTGNYIRA